MNRRRTIVSGFLRSLDSRPDAVALEWDDTSLTYGQLWGYAGRLSAILDRVLDSSDTLVAVLASRSIAAYGGIIGITATGRGYVPLNPRFPFERTAAMLAASGATAVIVGAECAAAAQALRERLPDGLAWIFPDHAEAPPFTASAPVLTARDLTEVAQPRDPNVAEAATAYLLFTSGSTGKPKGVPVSQTNVASYLTYIGARYDVRPEDRCSQNFELTFDLSVHDLFVCWDAGATLCPATDQYVVPADLIPEKNLTVWFSVPSIAMMASKLGLLEPRAFPTLRLSLFCGEALSERMAAAWQTAAPDSRLENLYGPTEATIAISHYRWDPDRSPAECVQGIVPIGWMFDGQRCRVVNDRLEPVSVSEAGELCLGGSQVTAGYLTDPDRTREQFVELPGVSGGPWYRTGDLVTQDARGCLYYLGRIDQQVKINGFRVELQEIERLIREAVQSDWAVAVPWPVSEGTAAGIVAVVAGVGEEVDDRLIDLCRRTLPRYMVPSRVYHFDKLPLNASGKVDRPMISRLLENLV